MESFTTNLVLWCWNVLSALYLILKIHLHPIGVTLLEGNATSFVLKKSIVFVRHGLEPMLIFYRFFVCDGKSRITIRSLKNMRFENSRFCSSYIRWTFNIVEEICCATEDEKGTIVAVVIFWLVAVVISNRVLE